jgi:hypothetical protein
MHLVFKGSNPLYIPFYSNTAALNNATIYKLNIHHKKE